MTTDYRRLADEIENAVAAGRIAAGTRLRPQRQYAFERGVAISTASRVYAELARRGLVSGEVGRGTYVLAPGRQRGAILSACSFIDLEQNFPVLDGQGAMLAEALASCSTAGFLQAAMRAPDAGAAAHACGVTAGFLARQDWSPDAGRIVFANNGREALLAAFAALAPRADRVGVEPLTYSVIKDIAARTGVTLVPIAMDKEGILPGALIAAHEAAPLRAVYLQPSLHNPLGATMSERRRRDVAQALHRTGLIAIEDAVNAFLVDAMPLAALAPEHTVLVDSLSKRIAPGLTLGFMVAPAHLVRTLAAAVRATAWTAIGWTFAAAVRLMAEGVVQRLVVAKREDAAIRQSLARDALKGLSFTSDPRAYHLWLELPVPWRADEFALAAAQQGIAVTPASAFAVSPGHAPAAVRLALGSPAPSALIDVLTRLRSLALSPPERIID